MKKVFFFLLTILALHTMSAQPTGVITGNVVNVVCKPILFKYLGEFRLPNNQVEIRWQAYGQVQNMGNATFHSTGAHLGLAVANTDTKVSKKVMTLQPGAVTQVDLEVRYIKGQPKPNMSLTWVVDGSLECYKNQLVPTWVPPF